MSGKGSGVLHGVSFNTSSNELNSQRLKKNYRSKMHETLPRNTRDTCGQDHLFSSTRGLLCIVSLACSLGGDAVAHLPKTNTFRGLWISHLGNWRCKSCLGRCWSSAIWKLLRINPTNQSTLSFQWLCPSNTKNSKQISSTKYFTMRSSNPCCKNYFSLDAVYFDASILFRMVLP